MAVYVIKCNPLSGCLEPTKVSGNESLTLGCVWNSTDVAATINDCDGCQLAQLNQTSVALGLDATALNNGTSLGLGASSTCTAIALGCGATATDNGIAIGTNLTACCDEVLIGDKVIIADNTVINGSDGGCSNVVAINATATASCQVVINDLIDVTSDYVTLGSTNIYAKVCCDCIDIKGCTAAVNVDVNKVAIGANVTGTACSVAIGCGASVSCAGDIAIGSGAAATCGIDIKSPNAEVCISNNRITIGHCINSTDECGFIAGNNINVCADLSNTVIGSNISFGCTLSGAGNTIIGYGHELVNSVYSDLTIIGSCIDECGIDFKGCINDRDVILGTADSAFQLCASNGYLYSAGGSCLMTGRILNCAAELPATNCSLLLYYVP